MHTILKRRSLGLPLGDSRPPSLGIGFRLCETLQRAADTLLAWQERRAQRIALAKLEDRMLKDIGLTRADVAAEVTLPFWRRRGREF